MSIKDRYYHLADQVASFREDIQELRLQQEAVVQQLHRLLAAREFDAGGYKSLRKQYHELQNNIEARLPSTAAHVKEQVTGHERAMREIAQARVQLLLSRGNEFPPLTADRLEKLQELNQQNQAHRQALQNLSPREPELKAPQHLPKLAVNPGDLQKMARDLQYGVQGLVQALDRGL